MPGAALEIRQQLSRSIIWKLQRRFFAAQGIDAWRKRVVPHYITSNPFIARAYSRVVSAFVRDCLAGGLLVDPEQPLYLVELGAGSGRFAYHFLKQFLACRERLGRGQFRFRYVMTDFAPLTLEHWKLHPSLRPFVEQGYLAFARFDAGRSRAIRLFGSQETLAPGTVTNPLIVLANYFFDSIPQDLFSVRMGRLYEQRISVFAPEGNAELDKPDLLERIQIDFDDRPARENYYGDPVLDDLLGDYRRLGDATLLFPCAAIRCLRDLSRLSGGRMLLVSADQGYSSKEEVMKQAELAINLHGSVSMMVNYHALGEYVRKRGGQVLHPGSRPVSLNVSCFLLGYPADRAPETRRAFDEAIVQFGPDDFFTLKKGIEKTYDVLSLQQILAYLRLSAYDANVFLGASPALLRLVERCPAEERENLRRALLQVWENYYPLAEQVNLPFLVGVLLYRTGWFREALEMFQHSQRLRGPDSCTSYNLGMCYHMLGEQAAAEACLDEAQRLSPACP